MSDERDLILYYLRIHFSNLHDFERIDEQQENIDMMKRVIELSPILSSDERNILNYTYKNAVTSRRNAISNLIQYKKEESNGARPERVAKLTQFIAQLLEELKNICEDLVSLVDRMLLPAANEPEQRVFYEKLKGDYYRYVCENRERSEIEPIIQQAAQCYEAGLEIARSELQPINPTLLGLVLNYSVFLYDIMDMKNEAIELSSKTFNDTVDLVDNMDEATYADTALILRYLMQNHTNWKKERDQVE
ncbi:14-3-3-like protein 2 [Tritrichomonas foetus]|uniref:14-3-3-like protein 2 n=1 Tax=Tritrichomonas foetus TaxID=1144522 RepID=A0A1J4KCH5_9EUKA|nr:14-3-3-like protein 2 [Tritrichomonas foetus]|eukprot:OHT07350.1 14-3-3-like protein 2 [Tritrichomonas foetus]